MTNGRSSLSADRARQDRQGKCHIGNMEIISTVAPVQAPGQPPGPLQVRLLHPELQDGEDQGCERGLCGDLAAEPDHPPPHQDQVRGVGAAHDLGLPPR